MDKEKELKKLMYLGLISLILAISSYFFWGIVGTKFSLGILILFFIPFYIVIDSFNFEYDETIIFSFIIGLGLYATLVYYIAFLLGSLKISIILSALSFYVFALIFKFGKYKKVDI